MSTIKLWFKMVLIWKLRSRYIYTFLFNCALQFTRFIESVALKLTRSRPQASDRNPVVTDVYKPHVSVSWPTWFPPYSVGPVQLMSHLGPPLYYIKLYATIWFILISSTAIYYWSWFNGFRACLSLQNYWLYLN